MNVWKGKWELIGVGRRKITRTIEIKTQNQFEKEIKKYVLSPGFGYEWNQEENDGFIYAGWNTVGKFKKVYSTGETDV